VPTDTRATGRDPIPDPVLEGVLELWDQAGARSLIPITGNSMLPLIREGDQVLVVHGRNSVRRGDVVVFRRQGQLIAHRVLRIDDDEGQAAFLVKGDNLSTFDPLVDPGAVLGRVLAVQRGNRSLALDSTSWRVWGGFVAITTLALARLCGWGYTLFRRLVGSRSDRPTASLCPGAKAFSAFTLRAIQGTICRWKDGELLVSPADQDALNNSPRE
jgi:hypothetical protein